MAPWTAACQTSLSITNSQNLLETHVHRVGDAIQPSRPLSSPSPPAFNLFPASGAFSMSQFFTSGGQSVGASESVLPKSTQGRFLFRLIWSCSPRDSQSRNIERAQQVKSDMKEENVQWHYRNTKIHKRLKWIIIHWWNEWSKKVNKFTKNTIF